ncbi:MAG TPA: exodeoxyribonuclease III [Rhodocyclaceae bacterium]|nr:exodeoxyribonuclease III [Betaproteobacteria bacterium]HMV00620.1 exodeoxyribonuclease III [Rhodocyclaceae bacterium]HMV20971.1 exodeoxyribonuclease III [Rhodocyclaceae bacterium]HMW78166.1 exodeoxyribonuclease III [Rhodocyclaceae bacterium]HNE43580.1 exodeoxyribonuclease III [Rhodocyclaceae bacterium]
MRIATWNVNSLKVRLPHLLDWLAEQAPAVVCLQETKVEDANFPRADLEAAGYRVAFSGQKTYNGVALVARDEIRDVVSGNPHFPDEQKRLIAGTVGDVRVICAYVPNGQAVDSDKYRYKLAWLEALVPWLKNELNTYPNLVLAGDFNIAPEDRDVHDPQAWAGQILCSPAERTAFGRLLELGLRDSFRLFEQPDKSYSWWDYRMLGFQKNLGLRIDHVLLSGPLAGRCVGAGIDRAPRKRERPSDHAPAYADLA